MEYYKLRIDYNDEKKESYKKIESYFDVYMRVFETADTITEVNPHFHYYIEMSKTAVALRQQIRLLIGKGNGVYSLKKCDQYPIEYIAYMLKTNRTTYHNSGVPQSIIDEAIAYDDQVKNDIKRKKLDKKDQWKKIAEYVSDRCVIHDRIDICERVIQYHIDNDIMIREFYVKSVTDTIFAHRLGDGARKLAENYYRFG